MRNALRMRPDRIVVGEVRGPEALDMLTALSTGHDGSLCTVHAGSAAEALRRLETLALMADVGLPHAAIREQVADAIDLVVCQARAADGSRRVTARRGGRARGGRSGGAGDLHAARRPPDLARAARRRPGHGSREDDPAAPRRDDRSARPVTRAARPRVRRVRHEPGGAARGGRGRHGVLGAWDVLATAEAARLADRLARAVAPLGPRSPRGPRAERGGAAAARAARRGLAARRAAGCSAARSWAPRPRSPVRPPWSRPCARGAGATARRCGAARRALLARSRTRSPPGTRSAARCAEVAPALPGAAGHELRIAARALALGEPTEAVLERLRTRAASRAWDTLVAAILLQRDAGGDLPALLRELAAALEAADRLERDARTATAQARFTAWLVVGLPVAAAALAELAAPGFLRALVAAPLTAALTALALLLQATGLVAIHRIVRAPRA